MKNKNKNNTKKQKVGAAYLCDMHAKAAAGLFYLISNVSFCRYLCKISAFGSWYLCCAA